MMNIRNFESSINKKILERGYDYYISGNIMGIRRVGDYKYIFQIEGSDDYEVEVKIDGDGEILESSCDCPYDYSPICKHQVAAFFELTKIIDEDYDEEHHLSATRPTLSHVLQTLAKNELINIIMEIAKKDKVIEDRLIFNYSKADHVQQVKTCKELIASIFDRYSDTDGFIPYGQVYPFTSELGEVLEKATHSTDPLLSLEIAFLVLDEAIEAFQYADDSGGNIGLLVTETIGFVDEVFERNLHSEHDVKKELLDKLLQKSESRSFEGWEEFRIALLRAGVYFAENEHLRNRFKWKVESFISDDEDDRYYNESFLRILYDLITEYGTELESEQFIKDHLRYTSFRELWIENQMKEKNYQMVIKLALEAEQQDSRYAGLVLKWKRIRYEAYKKLSLKEEQQTLAMELFMGGDFNFYKELKELNGDAEEVFYNRLKNQLKTGGGWHRTSLFLKLVKEENDLDELMEFVRKNPKYIEEYAEMLADSFKDEVIDVYKQFIHLEAGRSSDRKRYRDVCKKITNYTKLAGKEKREELVAELSSFYYKRPAFLDELGKIRS